MDPTTSQEMNCREQRFAQLPIHWVAVRSTTVDRFRPMISATTATMKPASGPATPMSNSARRFMIGPRKRIIAPNVPTKYGGPGMNNGSDAGTPVNAGEHIVPAFMGDQNEQ